MISDIKVLSMGRIWGQNVIKIQSQETRIPTSAPSLEETGLGMKSNLSGHLHPPPSQKLGIRTWRNLNTTWEWNTGYPFSNRWEGPCQENTNSLKVQDAHTCLGPARHSPQPYKLHSKMNQSTSFYKELGLCSNFSTELCYKHSQNITDFRIWELLPHPKPNSHLHQHLSLRLEQSSRCEEGWVHNLSQVHSLEQVPESGHIRIGVTHPRNGKGQDEGWGKEEKLCP